MIIKIGGTTTLSGFYALSNQLFANYNQQANNFIIYLVDGIFHVYTDQDLYYTTNALTSISKMILNPYLCSVYLL